MALPVNRYNRYLGKLRRKKWEIACKFRLTGQIQTGLTMNLNFRITLRQVLAGMVFFAVVFFALGQAWRGQFWGIALVTALILAAIVQCLVAGLYWIFRLVGVLSRRYLPHRKPTWFEQPSSQTPSSPSQTEPLPLTAQETKP